MVELVSPPIDETMMIEPSPRSSISGAAMAISQWLAMTLLSRILRNCSSRDPRHRPVIGVGRGVADQHVDPAECAFGFVDEVLQRGLVGDAGGDGDRRARRHASALIAAATSSQASCLRLEMTTFAPWSAIAVGDRQADAARRAGDDRDLAGQVEQAAHASAIRMLGELDQGDGAVVNLVRAVGEAQRADAGPARRQRRSPG